MSKATSQLMGVCATISNKTGIDVFIIRIITIIIMIAGGGTPILIYFLLGLFASEV
jgi:phage shock protein PspC (stress-responsive transcriptional regulator)